jgi:hypothetical protein
MFDSRPKCASESFVRAASLKMLSIVFFATGFCDAKKEVINDGIVAIFASAMDLERTQSLPLSKSLLIGSSLPG